MRTQFLTVVFLILVALAAPGARQAAIRADHTLPSRPENLTWGWIPTDARPVLSIASGQTVRIDTLSHHGSTQDEDPVPFLGRFGVKPEEVLQDVRDFWASRPSRPREGRGGAHVLTGPIASPAPSRVICWGCSAHRTAQTRRSLPHQHGEASRTDMPPVAPARGTRRRARPHRPDRHHQRRAG